MPRKQALVIGLGQFGMALARSLSAKGVEVLAVDNSEEHINVAKEFAETLQFDATDAESLARTSPDRRDVCICAIGDDSRESSIICTALLKQMGAKRIVARANDDLHARILKLVGASDVVNPENDFGERYAWKLIHSSVVGELSVGKDLYLSEIRIPESFVGRTLVELQLPRRFNVTLVAVQHASTDQVTLPSPDLRFEAGDIMIVVAQREALNALLEKV